MRKINFNSIENLTVPDIWVEKALLLPEKVDDKKVLYFSKYSRPLVAVASLFLVCALSVSLFFLTQKDDILKTDPTIYFENETIESTVCATEMKEDVTIKSEVEATEKNDFSNLNSQTDNVTKAEETENITQNPTSAISKPTQNHTESPTKKPAETEPVTKPQPTDNPKLPEIETTPQPTYPIVEPETPEIEAGGICIGYIEESLLCGSSTVYCVVEPKNSDVMMPDDSITKYIADVSYIGNGYVRISFAGNISSFVTSSDYYVFYFYNINGDIIYKDTIYVTVN